MRDAPINLRALPEQRDLIDQAAMQFNLSPKDAEFLNGFFRERQEPRA